MRTTVTILEYHEAGALDELINKQIEDWEVDGGTVADVKYQVVVTHDGNVRYSALLILHEAPEKKINGTE